ncbi:YdcF family protein [Variovorax paradoxus]|nr:YdcF family protein [Variovorax paradoxus]MBT2302698.1 YdcF family protein [Variovorax paradoxus]
MRKLWRVAFGALGVLLLGYAAIAITIWLHALDLLGHPPQRAADAALILGNRAYRDGKPNPCLTGRVDTGISLAKEGRVRQLVLSGGIDREDGRIEAEVMQQHARDAGYTGTLLLEPVSSTTRENLSMSRAVLQAAGVKSVIIVSEPYHLWRVERLARAAGFDRLFELQYAAAPTSCWRRWGMLFKGALREPLAIVNNAANGYLH